MTTIVAFGAHPDDIEFGCGGILIEAHAAGASVHHVVLSKGEAGSAGNAEIRAQETVNAAKIVGAQLKWLDLGGDSHLEYNLSNKMVLAGLIRELRPDIVLIPLLQENQHPDHYLLARLVRDACRLARYGGLDELKDRPAHKVGALYSYASTSQAETNPDILVDISPVFDTWREAIMAHQSQMGNKSYDEMLIARARYLGLMAGVDYAMGLWSQDPVAVKSVLQIGKTARGF